MKFECTFFECRSLVKEFFKKKIPLLRRSNLKPNAFEKCQLFLRQWKTFTNTTIKKNVFAENVLGLYGERRK